jgi:hypothetical protein
VALQEWLVAAHNAVVIGYADELAELVPPVAVRLRRDFGAVLNLIRAHAALHQATRERDQDGRIVATLEDYRIVRALVADLLAEGVEATVPPTVRETVDAVAAAKTQEGISLGALARTLQVDKSVASRRWNNARARGYLKNLETQRGKPARIVVADPLPDDVQILPTVDLLDDRCTVAGVANGVPDPAPPADDDAELTPEQQAADGDGS